MTSKLLNINSYHYRRGGSDVVYLEHAALMADAGWDVGYFSMHHPKNLQTPWSRYFIEELEFGGDYSLMQKVRMAGKAIYSFEAQRKLKQLLADFPADVAHLHCIYHHHSPSILPVLREAGVRTVMTAHDLKLACPAYKMLNDTGVCERCKDGSVMNVIRHRCVRGSLAASAIVAVESGVQRHMKAYETYLDKVVSPSRFFIDKFVEWGWPRDRFAYIPNYVDAARFTPDFDPGEYFLYFGRIAPEKGVATLLTAAKAAGVTVKLAGTGPDETMLREQANRLGVDAAFLGFQSGEDLHRLIRGARAVVLPSEWYENAPMSVLESFALGTPVIGADIGGIPEMIEHGETGWTFPSRNAQVLADLLTQVAAMPAGDLSRVGRGARDLVEKKFHQTGYRQAMSRLYSELGVGGAV